MICLVTLFDCKSSGFKNLPEWTTQNEKLCSLRSQFWMILFLWFFKQHVVLWIFRFRLCFASLTIVGLGSWLFHMTLQYEMQLLDELPMLWGSCILIYCMCQIRAPIKQAENATLALTLTAIAITLSIIHLTFKIAILFFVRIRKVQKIMQF